MLVVTASSQWLSQRAEVAWPPGLASRHTPQTHTGIPSFPHSTEQIENTTAMVVSSLLVDVIYNNIWTWTWTLHNTWTGTWTQHHDNNWTYTWTQHHNNTWIQRIEDIEPNRTVEATKTQKSISFAMASYMATTAMVDWPKV